MEKLELTIHGVTTNTQALLLPHIKILRFKFIDAIQR